MRVYKKFYKPEAEKGQILLLVVLTLAVTITIGLSVAARSAVNVKMSTDEENSQRAFSAAEAGLEKTTKTKNAESGSFSNYAQYNTSVASLVGTQLLLNNNTLIPKDDGADLWLAKYPDYTAPWSGNLTIYWGSAADICTTGPTANTMAALEVIVLSGTKAAPTIAHYTADPCTTGRRSANKFTAADGAGTVAGKSFPYSVTISGITSGLLARIVPLYASTPVGITSSTALPVQGQIIDATGSSGSTQRKITLFKGYPKVPIELFQFVLFTPQ